MRQLTAIMFTDMVGFTALMQTDESRARAAVESHRDVVRTAVDGHNGELAQFYEDGTLTVFRSAVDATDCAIAHHPRFASHPRAHAPSRVEGDCAHVILERLNPDTGR